MTYQVLQTTSNAFYAAATTRYSVVQCVNNRYFVVQSYPTRQAALAALASLQSQN